MGSKVQNSTFSEHGHVAYQIKENHKCSNMEPNILLADTLTLGMGQIGQNLPSSEQGHIENQFKGNQKMQQQGSKYLPGDAYPFFSVHGHVTYQIKESHKCSYMVANILPADILDPADGVNRSKFNFFRTWP